MRNSSSTLEITWSNDVMVESIEESQGQINTELVRGDVSAHLAWKDLNVIVALKNGESRSVLQGLIGYAEPGTFTALMGPSGSGKSTLLDALSGRLAAKC